MFDSFIGKQKLLSGLDSYNNGLKLADTWLERQKNAEMAKIQTQTQNIENSDDRFREMIGLAKQSKRSKWLLDDINAMQSAQAQAELANREKMAGIDKTMSETNKNNATATDTMAGVAKKRMDMTMPLYEVLAGSGNLEMGRSFLKNRHTMGAIDDEQYQALLGELATLEGLTGDELKNWAWHIRKGDLPVDVLHQTADNQADNETKFDIAKMDNNTRFDIAKMDNNTKYDIAEMQDGTERYKTDQNNATARYQTDQKTQLELIKAEQEQAMRAGEVESVQAGLDGNTYIVYKDGRVEKALEGVALGNGAGQAGQANNIAEEKKRLEKFAMTVQDIEETIKQSTGSIIGTGVDWAGRLVGYSTDGAKAIAKLNALAGQLTALQPKMSGPQSDKDVQLYREMAGDLNNSTLPVETRLEALKVIKALNDKYAKHAGVDISQWQSSNDDDIQIQDSAFF